MNVLIIGGGGREHALTLAISKSESCGNIFAAPGNPGIFKIAKRADIKISDFLQISNFCKENQIDLVVVGPEQPLADGISDALRGMGHFVFGPSKDAAMLEVSKDFAKKIMIGAGVPTAAYKSFNSYEKNDALEYIQTMALPLVIKADGLAAGKGVIIAESMNDAEKAINSIFSGEFGNAGTKIVIEEFMTGEEASVFAICDGKDYFILPPAQDHKKIFDGEKGKNTGGMGSFAPTPMITPELMTKIENIVIKPVVDFMNERGTPFIGCLYAGLMITPENEPKVVEFNVRFGDPETQTVLNVIEGDFLKLLYSAASGKIDKECVKNRKGIVATCVVLAANGYPDSYEKGDEIYGINDAENSGAIVYHAGTMENEGRIYTNGGRVLGVTAMGKNLFDSIQSAYKAVSLIDFKSKYHRNDIGIKGIQQIQW